MACRGLEKWAGADREGLCPPGHSIRLYPKAPEEPLKGFKQKGEWSRPFGVFEALEHPVGRGTTGPGLGREVHLEKENKRYQYLCIHLGVNEIARKHEWVRQRRGAGFWGQKGDWGVAADEGDGNPDTGLPTDYQELAGSVGPELGVRWGQPWRAGTMEGSHSTKEVVAEETESSTEERGEAAKRAMRLGICVRVGSRQSLGGYPGPMGMMEGREGIPGVLFSQGRVWIESPDKIQEAQLNVNFRETIICNIWNIFILKHYPSFLWNSNLTGCPSSEPQWMKSPLDTLHTDLGLSPGWASNSPHNLGSGLPLSLFPSVWKVLADVWSSHSTTFGIQTGPRERFMKAATVH